MVTITLYQNYVNISKRYSVSLAWRYVPSAVFFGNVSFQIEPETGDIYFAQFYGDYACLRAGRKVEGVILVNASTGKCETHLLNDIPNWVTGVSF